jgi:hypothetical protein
LKRAEIIRRPRLPLGSTDIREILDGFAGEVTRFLSAAENQQGDFSEDVRDYAKSIRASSDVGNRKRRHAALESVTRTFFSQQSATQPRAHIAPLQDGLFDENGSDDT